MLHTRQVSCQNTKKSSLFPPVSSPTEGRHVVSKKGPWLGMRCLQFSLKKNNPCVNLYILVFIWPDIIKLIFMKTDNDIHTIYTKIEFEVYQGAIILLKIFRHIK